MTTIEKTFIITTIFPEIFPDPLGIGLIGKALKENKWNYKIIDMKINGKNNRIDREPMGGGGGMIITPEVLGKTIDPYINNIDALVFTTPSGYLLKQNFIANFNYKKIFIVCGRYEGFDNRVVDFYRDLKKFDVFEISCGDYILCGGELCSMVFIESLVRTINGVVNNCMSILEESFSEKLLEGPIYTSPREWRGYKVPETLFSGDRIKINQWKKEKALERTIKRRPDLLKD